VNVIAVTADTSCCTSRTPILVVNTKFSKRGCWVLLPNTLCLTYWRAQMLPMLGPNHSFALFLMFLHVESLLVLFGYVWNEYPWLLAPFIGDVLMMALFGCWLFVSILCIFTRSYESYFSWNGKFQSIGFRQLCRLVGPCCFSWGLQIVGFIWCWVFLMNGNWISIVLVKRKWHTEYWRKRNTMT